MKIRKSPKGKQAFEYQEWCKNNGYNHLVDETRKQKLELWLEKTINWELPENFINDKREYYRSEYLKSEHWKTLRFKKIIETNCCEKCTSKVSLDVHHLNYKNLFDVELNDLQVLCRKCHMAEHENDSTKKKVKHKRKNDPLIIDGSRQVFSRNKGKQTRRTYLSVHF